MAQGKYKQLQWPSAGLVRKFAFEQQAPFSAPACSNVRPYESVAERARGGSRPGTLSTGSSFNAGNSMVFGDWLLADLLWVNAGTPTVSIVTNATIVGVTVATDKVASWSDYRQNLYIAGDNSSNHALIQYDPNAGAGGISVRADSSNAHASGTGTDMRFTYSLSSGHLLTGAYVKFAGIANTNATAWNYATNGSLAYQITVVDSTHFDVTDPTAPAYNVGTTLSTATWTQLAAIVPSPSSTGKASVTATGDSGNAHVSGTGNDMRFTVTLTSGYINTGAVVRFEGVTGTNASSWNYHSNGNVGFQIIQHDSNHYDVVDSAAPVYSAGTTLSGATASQLNGTLPIKCRIVTRHGDRLYLAGDEANPHLWYASAVGDALNWDYGAATSGAAVAASNSEAGATGEPITAMISHTNLCLVFGCKSSLWVLRGDPNGGGQLSCMSSRIGILDRFAWCHDPEGQLWFLSNDGLYVVPAGCNINVYTGQSSAPEAVSRDTIPEELTHVDPATYQVSMAYDVQHRGILILITKSSDGSSPGHWWFEPKQRSFWPFTMPGTQNPMVALARRNFLPGTKTQSFVWLGGYDGTIRNFDEAATTDHGSNAISSYVDFGPFPLGAPGYDGVLSELQLVTAASSGTVTAAVRVGRNGEEAYNASTFYSKDMTTAGLNYTARPMARGHAAIVRLSSTAEWGLEDLNVATIPAGQRRIP